MKQKCWVTIQMRGEGNEDTADDFPFFNLRD